MTARVQLAAAYVLHSRAYRETSLLVEVLAREHGRLGAVARGARRARSPWRGLLEPFRPLLLSWGGRGDLATLSGAEPGAAAGALPAAAIASGLYLNELLVRLLHRHDPHPELFDAYDAALGGLRTAAGVEPVLRVFEKRLLQAVGYGLVLDHAADADRPIEADRWYAYLPETGPVDADAAAPDGIRVRGASLLALERERLDGAEILRDAKRLMRAVLAHHLGERPLAARALFGPGRRARAPAGDPPSGA